MILYIPKKEMVYCALLTCLFKHLIIKVLTYDQLLMDFSLQVGEQHK